MSNPIDKTVILKKYITKSLEKDLPDDYSPLGEAMDEYGQGIAIDFGKWLHYNCELRADYLWGYLPNRSSKEKYTTEELFELYRNRK